MSITLQQAQQVLTAFRRNQIFTAHDFIKEYRKLFEREYIQDLSDAISNANPAHPSNGGDGFREVNRQIARSLSVWVENGTLSNDLEHIQGYYYEETDFDRVNPVSVWRRL